MTATPTRRIVAIGECMVELASAGNGLYRKGFAGDTFNTAWYLRRELGADWQVAYLTALGSETTSDEMLAFFADAGIEIGLVRRIDGAMPGLYMIHLDGAERSFSYWRDTSAARQLAADPDHLDAAFASGEAFYFSGITLAILTAGDRKALLERLGAAKEAGKTVAFDPNIRPRLWPDPAEMRHAVQTAASVSTICLPSFPDEEAAFGDGTPAATAERYLDCGADEVVVKDGPAPALVAFADTREEVSAKTAILALDTTGAGDSFSAAYLAARLEGGPPVVAAHAGHALAAQVVQHYGALLR